MLQLWPVSRRVNRAGNENDPKLIFTKCPKTRDELADKLEALKKLFAVPEHLK
jgi:hypothetical protein